MFKLQKKRALDITDLMIKAHNEVRKNVVNSNNLEESYMLLEQCQQCAINIENSIKKTDINETDIIKKLEIYCEDVIKLNSQLNSENNCCKLIDLLDEKVKGIKDDIASIKAKYEVVFMPYKASMWDSMESIWKSAKEDEECNVNVIPIKYVEFTNKREINAIKYEGNLFPEYVNINDYHNYNFEEIRPDVIYIHNPYDGSNYVTSVDPQFYSDRLKKFTEKLVFVPYFVSNTGNYSKGCLTASGVLNSDRVILESEKIKNQYCELWEKLIKKSGCFQKESIETYLKRKFLALGSPKIDKAINSEKDVIIPQEWENIIGNKRVILYNTHLVNLMIYKEAVIDKLRSVFELFKDNSEFVLLWRPHPLSQQTIVSMNKDLLNKYNELKNWYIENNVGIYDDSSELHRALSVADGYLGDYSSLLTLFGVKGKPMMTQSVKIFDTDKDMFELDFESWFIDRETSTAWMTGLYVNGLFKMNLKNGKIDYVNQFPWYSKNSIDLYTKVYKYKNKLVFTPYGADCIAIYDIEKNKFSKIDIEKNKCEEDKFINIASYGNYVYLIGRNKPVILRLDMRTKKVMYINDLIHDSQGNIIDFTVPCFEKNLCIINECFYIPFNNCGLLLKFNMKELKYTLFNLGNEKTFFSVCFDGEKNLWISPRKMGSIIKFNIETEDFDEYNNYPDGFESYGITFSNIEYCNGFIWLIPAQSNMLLKMNEKDGHMECIKRFDKIEKQNTIFHYYFSYVENGLVKMFSLAKHKIVHFDNKNNEVTDYVVNVSKEVKEKGVLNKNYLVKGTKIVDYLISESDLYTIKDFLEYVKECPKENIESQKNVYRSMFSNSDGSAGEKIHQYIKKELIEGI